MKRRSVIFLVALATALAAVAGFSAAPAHAAIGPNITQTTLEGMWPACATVTGGKKVMAAGHLVGTLHNRFEICSGPKGKIRQPVIHLSDPPTGSFQPASRHWRYAFYKIPGQPSGVIVIAKATFVYDGLLTKTVRVCIRARGASTHNGFWAEYCNAP